MNNVPYVPHQLTANVKVLQKAVLEHDGMVLLIRRDPNDFSRANCWDTPGGNAEWPQEITEPTSNLHQQDIAREIEEETGIIISADNFNHEALTYFETFFEPERQIYTVLLGWHYQLPSTFTRESVVLSHEHSEYVWVSKQDALEYDFGGTRGEFMKRIITSTTKA